MKVLLWPYRCACVFLSSPSLLICLFLRLIPLECHSSGQMSIIINLRDVAALAANQDLLLQVKRTLK